MDSVDWRVSVRVYVVWSGMACRANAPSALCTRAQATAESNV